ncbi:MAG TPA: NUDIX hydrolase [bacterium]|nr:NUDIX hydrolase [bacterium]HPN45983.1 NUDIX hydrolase [bacterium]
MQVKSEPQWLLWAREIQALSQTGLAFSQSVFDTQRFTRLMEIAAEIIARHTDLEKEPLLETLLVQPGYATPKVDIRGAVFNDGKILLVQEKSDGLWCLPGGWADIGEGPSHAVAREVREESGFIVRPEKVVGVYDANRSGRPLELFHAVKIIFMCVITGGEATPSEETNDVQFFDFEDLPPLSSNRTNEDHLVEILAHYHDPARATWFE